MKVLTKLLLINWHYFSFEEIDFGNINFLTGKNASGKSTLIDALQLLLLGDTSSNFFNKAANGRSDRTLLGYLRGELGDDGASNFKYLRQGRFTSYIAAEFYDTNKDRYVTAGCCFDFYSENDYPHKFFIFDSAIPEHRFVVDGTPMGIRDLRIFIKDNFKPGKYELPDSNKDFRSKLYGKLGGLGERFSGLLRKAVPFSPIYDIQKFITEFVCDEARPIDIQSMRDNIRYYKDLEQEALVLQNKVDALKEINAISGSYVGFIEQVRLHDFTVSRAELQKLINEREAFKQFVAENQTKIADLIVAINGLSQQKQDIDYERITKEIDYKNNDAKKTIDYLTSQKEKLETQINSIFREYGSAQENMRAYGLGWRGIFTHFSDSTVNLGPSPFPEPLQTEFSDFVDNVESGIRDILVLLDANNETLSELGSEGLSNIKSRIDDVKNKAIELRRAFSDEFQDLSRKKKGLEATESDLKRGIKPFDPSIVALRDTIFGELSVEYGLTVEVNIFSEVIEIPKEKWRNAIEGYLHTQKFYLLVAPEHFQTALRIYERIKHDKKIYDVGLVDIEKILARNPRALPGSLAEEVETSSPLARAYADYLLGNVIKCDNVDELRKHERAITAGGMIYQGYVARQLHPKRWENPYIGRSAIARQLSSLREKIAALIDPINLCSKIYQLLDAFNKIQVMSKNDIDRTITAVESFADVPSLTEKIENIQIELGSIDTTYIDQLRNTINTLNTQISKLDKEIREKSEEKGRYEEYNKDKTTEDIPRLSQQITDKQSDLDERFDDDWVREIGYPKYYREISARPRPEDVIFTFNQQLSRARSQSKEKWNDLVKLRGEYNANYKMGHNINNEDNSVYEKEFSELSSVQLPDYVTKIQDAKNKAFEQFQEDFLSRVKANIDDVRSQINQLNDALSRSWFGQDKYRFEIFPRQEYKRYYDMINDEMLLGGYNLLSAQFNEKYKEEIKDLFELVTDSGNGLNSDARAEYERRVQEFTNYRTYLTFDLKVTDGEGIQQHLSKTLGKKSGGETQTPFYISVLASFAQLYRITKGNDSGTIRLIIFDEAFSKMDGERISESIRLLRKFGFQVILSAPPEKIGDIATLVDRNLCVLRRDKRSFVKVFDPKQLEGIIGDEQ